MTAETLSEQFGRLGKTPYELRRLDAKIDGRPMVPLSVLGKLRHEMVRQLDAAAPQPPQRTIAEGSAWRRFAPSRGHDLPSPASGEGPGVRGARRTRILTHPEPPSRWPSPRRGQRFTGSRQPGRSAAPSHLHVLCRSMEQIEAALTCGVSSVIVDFGDLGPLRAKPCAWSHAAGAKVLLATPRIHKPGESDVSRLADARPDGVLVRNLAGLAFFRRTGLAGRGRLLAQCGQRR